MPLFCLPQSVLLRYPDANAFAEEFHEWSHASGPFYKTPDEARFVNRIRDALALEEGDALYLASEVPRRWIESPSGIRGDRIATYFGSVSYSMKPGFEPGTIEAAVQLPVRNPAGKVWLVARMPQGRIQSVMINGQLWTRIDQEREAIELPPGQFQPGDPDPLIRAPLRVPGWLWLSIALEEPTCHPGAVLDLLTHLRNSPFRLTSRRKPL